MCFFDFIKQHHAVRPAANSLCELATFFIADVARRGAKQAADGMPFLVLAHVNAHDGILIIEQEFSQSARQLRFANAGWTEEDKRADRPVGVLQTAARTAHSV